jgi:hypothetical protein
MVSWCCNELTLTTGAEGDGHSVGNLVDACLHPLAGDVVEDDVLGISAGDLRRKMNDAMVSSEAQNGGMF